ncbi:MAG TPA: hypothetical protein VFB36_14410 [Nevskiaceae bacterium]|nr:hypothetical protein [Nevskiaceae bacterium]
MIDRATEQRRLAQVLHRKPDELSYLKALDADALMKLRVLLQNSFIDQFSNLFQKLANSGKIVPDAVSAILCRKVFGPALTANMSYYVPADRAARLCKHFDADFMTAIAREQVPERAKALLDGLPVELMREVMRKMVASKDYHIMGAFLDHLPEKKAETLMQELRDVADHLRISSFAQHKDRVARLALKLDDDRLKELITIAFAHAEFMLDIGLVTAEMNADQQRRMAKLTDEINPDYRRKARTLAEQSGYADRLEAYFSV